MEHQKKLDTFSAFLGPSLKCWLDEATEKGKEIGLSETEVKAMIDSLLEYIGEGSEKLREKANLRYTIGRTTKDCIYSDKGQDCRQYLGHNENGKDCSFV